MTAPVVLRAVTLLAATALALVTLAVPALAHGRGSESTNYRSTVTAAPDLDGVSWTVEGGDAFLVAKNTSDTELVVPGYQGEPYLRIGPDGVFENEASEATYLNADRYADVSLPAGVGPDEEPRWSKISDGNSHAWHDHRIHWMSPSLPPAVTDPGERTLVQQWEVPFDYGGQEHRIAGDLIWVPPPSPIPWLAIALLVTLPALAGLRRSGDGWMTGLVRPAAAVLAAVSLVNLTHLVDDFLAVPLPTTTVVVSAVQTALFIAIGLFGAIVAWRERDGAFTALGVGAGGILIGQGLLYLDVLQSSQAASVFPDWTARAVVSLSLMQALPVGAVAVIGNRRLAGEAPEEGVAAEEVAAT